VAIKGLGGYHVACDATAGAAVDELRRRKGREARPFALMVRDLDQARALCDLDEGGARLLRSRERPIVLLPRRAGGPVASGVAPGVGTLGLMLPYTPLHALLMGRLAVPIVLTSGNLSDLPMFYRDDEADEGLAAIADATLAHDRPIAWRCDDSVVRWTGRRAIPIRRSRGFAPRPLSIASSRPIAALGGHLKNAFCLVKGDRAILSHHIGDLDELEAMRSLRATLAHYERLFAIAPAVIACDLHPDYASTHVGRELAESRGLPIVAVQHHHAHAASVMAEHGLAGPALGISLDGTGLGADGTVWGFEFLAIDGASLERLGHLETVRIPGGESAVREPRRMALAWLRAAYGGELPRLDLPLLTGLDPASWQVLERMLAAGVNAPLGSSAGRLFDAVAAILGIREQAQFEGQAAMELEAIASAGPAEAFPVEIGEGAGGAFAVKFGAAVRQIAEARSRGEDASHLSARFHRTVIAAIVAGAVRTREQRGLETALLSGGSFQNAILLDGAHEALEAAGFAVYTNERVPPNDGGLALGQAWVAARTPLSELAASPRP
jgi:hydrogenase maturation protein HypF